jgi:ABC-type multidrug transport system fused ATPase/permease subunit
MAYFAQLLGPTQMMANLSLTLQPAKVALQRIRELLQIIAEDEHATSKAITSLKGTIEFKDIDFAYEPTKPVFSKANMSIATGEKVLIAGPNGSGKSTLVKLLMGFYRPQQGVILFEGTALHRFSSVSIRERISVVSQNMFLFSDTVRNNVLYSVPEATEKEVKEALRLSGALEFVYAMPRGLDTEVGERGVRLSGGEKQKLSIARAILRKSDLIILDEATTHLDESAVLLLRDLIENQFADNTCIVIAPRPIDIPMINRAFWIEQGSIQEIALSPSVGQGAVLS